LNQKPTTLKAQVGADGILTETHRASAPGGVGEAFFYEVEEFLLPKGKENPVLEKELFGRY